MKKLALFFVTAAMSAMMAVTALAVPTYSEWYFQTFNTWPDGTVVDWEYDPVYWSYLRDYDPEEYQRLVNGQRTVIDAAKITDAYWSGSTAKWDVYGDASKYKVTLYRENGAEVTSKTTTNRSVSFSSSFPRTDYYYFEVCPYDSYLGQWGKWFSSETKYFNVSNNPSPSPSPVNPSSPTFSQYWYADQYGVWRVRNRSGQVVANAWLCDDAIRQNGQDVWYLLTGDGAMIANGLVQDNTGNFYSIETEHNGYFGMLRTKDGYYNCNGQQVYLSFNHQHNGSYGAITNSDGLQRLKSIYGVTYFGIGNENCVYTSRF